MNRLEYIPIVLHLVQLLKKESVRTSDNKVCKVAVYDPNVHGAYRDTFKKLPEHVAKSRIELKSDQNVQLRKDAVKDYVYKCIRGDIPSQIWEKGKAIDIFLYTDPISECLFFQQHEQSAQIPPPISTVTSISTSDARATKLQKLSNEKAAAIYQAPANESVTRKTSHASSSSSYDKKTS